MKIVIEKYNPEWKEQFELLRDNLLFYLKEDVINIEHVGSTSVPGMSAKPIIDLDIIIESDNSTLEKVIDKLNHLGYIHLGDLGITGREAFKRNSPQASNMNGRITWFKHNLYVCKEGSGGLNNHLSLKKHLLENHDKVIEYSKLKENLAEKFPNDIDAYIDGKTDFIVDILKKEGIKSIDINLIEDQNKI